MLLIAETGVCHLQCSSHLLICISLRWERTSPQFPLPIGWADGEAARVWLHLRQEINIHRQTYFSLIVNNRRKRVQVTKRIFLSIKRQTTSCTPNDCFVFTLFGSSIVLWSRELQAPIFWQFRVLVGWHVETRQCLWNVSWEDKLGSDGPHIGFILFFCKQYFSVGNQQLT